jgi:succinate dehydrogenase / fumarate reductase, cytochrome b subunit
MATTDAASGKRRARPLSPHLAIYKWTMTMAMSIVHRVTGVGLYIGVLLLAWFLVAASTDAATFGVFSGFIHSFIGQLILFGFTWALFQHLVGGLRHFVWDAGYAMDAPLRDQIAWGSAIVSVALTIIAWIIGYAFG